MLPEHKRSTIRATVPGGIALGEVARYIYPASRLSWHLL